MPQRTKTTVLRVFFGAIGLGVACGALASMIEPGGLNPEVDLERQFAETIHPLLKNYCFSCHGKEKHKGKLDLSAYSSVAAVLGDYSRWETVLAKLEANEMPPEEAERRPSAELRRNI
ncbi:MAG TPA: c-type cytochrome domain-containing protein, partial [Planctomycetota bacterium]|nr:c-type cytochrome domain-containing protein [Planctomycetota bacterium]